MTDTLWMCEQLRAGQVYNKVSFNTRKPKTSSRRCRRWSLTSSGAWKPWKRRWCGIEIEDCSLFDAKKWQKLLDRLGPDPLRDDADPEPGFAVIARRKTPIGQLLMDQSVFSGIGNIYRAELLFRAGIHPRRPGNEVPRKAIEGIWKDARRLMPQGIEDRRIVTTVAKDRPHKRGAAQDDEVHYVYRRQGKPCFRCGTKIEKEDMAGRSVYWCPQCQKR